MDSEKREDEYLENWLSEIFNYIPDELSEEKTILTKIHRKWFYLEYKKEEEEILFINDLTQLWKRLPYSVSEPRDSIRALLISKFSFDCQFDPEYEVKSYSQYKLMNQAVGYSISALAVFVFGSAIIAILNTLFI